MEQKKVDNVNHPNHYKSKTGLEVIDVIRAFTEDMNGLEGYYTGNVLKYMCRWKKKNGLEDLKKARVYLNWLIDEMEKKPEKPENGRYPWTLYEPQTVLLNTNTCVCEGVKEDPECFDTDHLSNSNDIVTMVVRDIVKAAMNELYGANNEKEEKENK